VFFAETGMARRARSAAGRLPHAPTMAPCNHGSRLHHDGCVV